MKESRPEYVWVTHCANLHNKWEFTVTRRDAWMSFTGYGFTEELAELHAILQAIEYERTNAKSAL